MNMTEKTEWLMTSFVYGQKPEKIDCVNGVLHGVSVVTEGEAKGHGVNLEAEFVKAVIEQGNSKKQGLKARFGHPNMSSTALGTFIGRIKNLREATSEDGKLIAKGDLFLSNSAKEAPGGDLHKYVLSLADEDAKAFGMSIVFSRGKEYIRNDKGEKCYDFSAGENEDDETPVFVELKNLHACDIVDDPAANPAGLFSAFNENTIAGQVSEFLDLHPQVFELVKQRPEIIQNFLQKYENYKSKIGAIEMKNESPVVAEPAKADSVPAVVETKPVEILETVPAPAVVGRVTIEEVKPETILAVVEPPVEKTYTAKTDELEKMNKEFGTEIAMKAILAGGGYDKARELHYEALKIENEKLKLRVGKTESSVRPAAAGVEPKEKPNLFNNIP